MTKEQNWRSKLIGRDKKARGGLRGKKIGLGVFQMANI